MQSILDIDYKYKIYLKMSLQEVILSNIYNMGYKYLKTIDTTSRSIVLLCSKGEDKYVIKVKYKEQDFDYEIKTGDIIKELKSDHIIKMVDYNIDYQTIVYPYFGEKCMDIFYVLQQYMILPEDKMKVIFKKILKGIEELHSIKILHCDIKPENILILDIDKDDIEVKIIDLEHAIKVPYIEKNIYVRKACTKQYSSPETASNGIYNNKSEIWGIGYVLYVMATGSRIRFNNNGTVNMKYIKKCRSYYSENSPNKLQGIETPLSDNFLDLLRNLLNIDDTKRPYINEILHHPWLNK